MLITKEQQETWVNTFAKDNTIVETWGFTQGLNKALTEVAKDCIDKQVAIRFAQHLLKDYSTIEVTKEDLDKYLKERK